jgi:peroxiredoxin
MAKHTSKRAEIRRRNRRQTPVWPVLAGIGLVIVALLLLPQKQGSPTTTESFSSVPAEVNFPAPELTLQNLNGETQSLSDFHGQVVLVNNWATWCPPCKAELPTLVSFYNDNAASGFVIIGIEGGEPADEVAPFVEKYQITYPIWLDPKNLSGQAFHNSALPNSYVIDRGGTVRLAWTGQISREMLDQYVLPLLAQ